MLFNDPVGVLLGFQDSDADTFDDDLDGDMIFGRSGQDLGTPDPANPGTFIAPFDGTPDQTAPQDNDDLVSYVPVFNELTATSYIDISGLDLTLTSAIGGRFQEFACSHGFGMSWLFGVRYLDIDDVFNVRGTGGLYDETTLNTSIENFIIGPQFGLQLYSGEGPVRFSSDIRCLNGINLIDGQQTGIVASNATATASAHDAAQPGGRNVNRPINLTEMAIRNTFESNQYSPVFEWRLDAAFAPTRFLRLRAGYTGMYIGEVARASGNTVYTLPSFGFASTARDGVYVNALTLGIEVFH